MKNFDEFVIYSNEHLPKIRSDMKELDNNYQYKMPDDEVSEVRHIVQIMTTAMLRQYHEWLSVQILESNINPLSILNALCSPSFPKSEIRNIKR